jgi:hypothetical protein
MPLTPLPASNTKRYKMRYTVGGINHSFTSRCSDAQTDAAAQTFLDALFADIRGGLGTNVTWVDLEVALSGSDVFNSTATWTPTSGLGTAVSALDLPRSVCIAGRTSGGRKTKTFLYGFTSTFATPDTYELDPIPAGVFTDWHSLLVSQADFWLGIDGIKPTWYLRATVKPNDHFVDKARV